MESFDVAVVGAGIIGSSVAFECAVRGARVVLLERQTPGSGASGMAAGMLAPCSETAEPGPFLTLGLDSLARWPGFAARVTEESGVDCQLVIDGVLRVALDEADAAVVQQRIAWQRDAGVAVQWVDADALTSFEPALSTTAGAAWYASEGQVNSARAVAAIVAAAAQHGVALRCGAGVVAVDGAGVRLGDGAVVSAATVALCAGPWTGGVLAALGISPAAIRPVLGQLIGIRGVAHPPEHVLYAGACGYALTRRDGEVIVGASEDDTGFDTAVRDAVTESLTGVARRLLRDPGAVATPAVWTGLRPATPDGLPLLGSLDVGSGPRVLVATGHYRNGVLLAPATAAGVASMALDDAVPRGWEAFDASRFPPSPAAP
jgi:glycine oxidase